MSTKILTVLDTSTAVALPYSRTVYPSPNAVNPKASVQTWSLDHECRSITLFNTDNHGVWNRQTVTFGWKSNGWFAKAGGHMAIGLRFSSDKMVTGTGRDYTGTGMIIGNVGTSPLGLTRYTQIETWFLGLHTGDIALLDCSNVNLEDGVQYYFTVYSDLIGTVSHVAYTIRDSNNNIVFDQPSVPDTNVWYNPRKTGVIMAYVLEDTSSTNWNIEVTNLNVVWI